MANYQNGDRNKCPICGKENIDIWFSSVNDRLYCYGCPDCGAFFAPNDIFDFKYRNHFSKYNIPKLKSYLFYHPTDKRAVFLDKDDYEKYITDEYVDVYNLTPEMVENWYPNNFNEKIDKILLWIAEKSKYMGDEVVVSIENLCWLFFMYNKLKLDAVSHAWCNEFRFVIKYLLENELISGYSAESLKTLIQMVVLQQNFTFILTESAWQKIYDLQKNQTNNKKIFIAMSFNPAIEKTYNAIDLAIREAKCDVVSMKHRIHNKQIVPEMLRLIKESKMLVMDISEPNFGAYYEAGYAQGLDKEVIITCKSSVIKKDKFLCDDRKGTECELLRKYSKPHFDIAQKQILVWEDEADLTDQLTEWIKFLMG